MTYSNQYVVNVLAASLIAEGIAVDKVKRAIGHAVDRITEDQISMAAQRIRDRANRAKADFEANVEFEYRNNQPPVHLDDVVLDPSFNARAKKYADKVASQIVVTKADEYNARKFPNG